MENLNIFGSADKCFKAQFWTGSSPICSVSHKSVIHNVTNSISILIMAFILYFGFTLIFIHKNHQCREQSILDIHPCTTSLNSSINMAREHIHQCACIHQEERIQNGIKENPHLFLMHIFHMRNILLSTPRKGHSSSYTNDEIFASASFH